MSAFTCDHGNEYPLFGTGGGSAGDESERSCWARCRSSSVARGGDVGEPVALAGTGPAAEPSGPSPTTIVTATVPPVAMAGCSARLLDAVEEHSGRPAHEPGPT